MKVLVVEDNPIIRTDFAHQFQKAGHDTAQAKDGDEAMHFLEAGRKFDLIVLDMKTPILSGECFLKRANAAGLLQGVAIGVTAYPEEMARGKELTKELPQYVGTLRKVLDTDDLPAAVSAKLAERRFALPMSVPNGRDTMRPE